MTDQDEVYQRAILELARDRTGAGRMEAPDGTATVDNPMCGDRVTIDLRLQDGHVTELHHHVRGCLLCEAAAGLLARHAPGADAAELRALPDKVAAFLADAAAELPERFAEGSAFTPVRPVRNRHRCVTLAFEAVVEALDDAGV
ncbi:MAG: iron-sulfur cluster assembly scaffold protein [Rhodospirillaceae bacterium]|nr:iron-sulfur cluster assembly scaffold protein [Rhodospirillaceae bacterium]